MLSCDWLRTALDLCGLIVILVLCVVLIFILCFLHPCLFCYGAKHHDTLRDDGGQSYELKFIVYINYNRKRYYFHRYYYKNNHFIW